MQTFDKLNRTIYEKKNGVDAVPTYPIKAIQVGDGNFIRSFVDWLIAQMNAKGYFQGQVVTVQALPTDQTTEKLNEQNGYYTVMLKGNLNGELIDEAQIIPSIEYGLNPYMEWESLLQLVEEEEVAFLFSNTTEAGIVYEKEAYNPHRCPNNYPAKVTALLYHRFNHFHGDVNKGWTMVPCELIERNGDQLKSICLQVANDWQLEQAFIDWVEDACVFCNTLVDRIVPGFPKSSVESYFEQLGYEDSLLTIAEPYHLFVIEGPSEIEQKLPFREAGLNVVFDQVAPYRNLKVTLLNGSHSILTLLGLLMKIENVKASLDHEQIRQFLRRILKDEMIASMPLDIQPKAMDYIEGMMNRFNNPFIEHKLTDISLNSFSKFQTRLLPSLTAYIEKYDALPKRLTFMLAAQFYYLQEGIRHGNQFIRDDEKVLKTFETFYRKDVITEHDVKQFMHTIIQTYFKVQVDWHEELVNQVRNDYALIEQKGIEEAIQKFESREEK